MAIAWAIAKGTRPIIGVTKPSQVEDAAKAAQIVLSNEEMGQLETLAKETNVDTRGSWENPMACFCLGRSGCFCPCLPFIN